MFNLRFQLVGFRVEEICKAVATIAVKTVHHVEEGDAFVEGSTSFHHVEGERPYFPFIVIIHYSDDVPLVDRDVVTRVALVLGETDLKIHAEGHRLKRLLASGGFGSCFVHP